MYSDKSDFWLEPCTLSHYNEGATTPFPCIWYGGRNTEFAIYAVVEC